MGDKVSLLNIVVYGHHGVTAEERAVGRPFEVDVELQLDLRRAGETDDLRATVNYAEICELVKHVNEAGPYALLETFAERLAQEVLSHSPVGGVTIRVRKPHPPVGLLVSAAEVEVTRRASGP